MGYGPRTSWGVTTGLPERRETRLRSNGGQVNINGNTMEEETKFKGYLTFEDSLKVLRAVRPRRVPSAALVDCM